MAKQTIGEFLATLRKANGYTQQEIADKLGISNRTLSGWECDKVLPDILLLPALADIYGVSVDEILAGERSNTRGSDGENSLFSQKKEKFVLQNRLNRFTSRAHALLGVFIVGIALIFVGWYLDIINAGQNAWQWWTLLLTVGLSAVVVSTALLFALWRNSHLTNEQSEHYANYRIIICRRFVNVLYVIAAVSFLMPVFQILGHITSPSKLLGYWLYVLLPLSIVYSVTILIVALRTFNATMGKYHAANDGKNNKGFYKKTCLFGLIPVGVALVILLTFACWKPSVRQVLYSNDNFYFVKQYVETFVDGDNEYALPLTSCERESNSYRDYQVGYYLYKFGYDNNTFYCNFYNSLECNIRNECVNADGETSIVYRQARRLFDDYRVRDKEYSLYNLRYWNLENELLEKDFVTSAKCGINVERRPGASTYYGEFYVDIEYDYSSVGLACATILLFLDIVVCAVICVYKKQKSFPELESVEL